ncbi:MAG TPA: hypothetical protein VK348_06240 [Planctomycetota bacterium]|nr:hypothetical protein [Planctomycetota bacterium]
MTILEFILLLLIAALIGAVGQTIAGYSHGGLLVSIAIGFIGAMLGSWIARRIGLPDLFVIQIDRVAFPVLWSVIGATLFVAAVGLLTRRTQVTM